MLHVKFKRLRLAVYCPRPHDATSLYRAMGPLSAMERQEPRLELLLPPFNNEGQELSWSWFGRADALFVQRPWLREHAQLIVQAKMAGVPVWVDWDDDYATVHPSNPSFAVYQGCEEMLDRIAKLADVVSVSTEEIKTRRSKATGTQSKFRVVPNACHWPITPGSAERMRRVSWRGGASHEYDLLQVLPHLAEIARLPQFGQWEWCFLGDVPWQVQAAFPRDRFIGGFGAEPYLYMEAMGKLLPFVHIVPLADTKFNPAKSNLAWLEATAAGAVVIAPDWQEWQRPGVINYSNRQDFRDKLIQVMASFAEHKTHPKFLESRAFIREHLLLEQVNQWRWQILNQLVP